MTDPSGVNGWALALTTAPDGVNGWALALTRLQLGGYKSSPHVNTGTKALKWRTGCSLPVWKSCESQARNVSKGY